MRLKEVVNSRCRDRREQNQSNFGYLPIRFPFFALPALEFGSGIF